MCHRALLSLVALLACAACGDDASPADAGPPDAARADAGARDAGVDGGFTPDGGPRATGCELLDGGMPDPPPPDAGGFEPFPPDVPPVTPAGPGGPGTTFTAADLRTACAYLDGGPTDRDHHNIVLLFDGYLYMPWAHQAGGGAFTVFEFDEPCAPVHVATVTDDQIRETHAVGVSLQEGGPWMAVASLSGIQIWNVADPTAPTMVTDFALPGVRYPDSYQRVVLSLSWQAPFLYVGAADNGVFIVDASDPTSPELVHTHLPLPELRVGGVHAIGNLLVIQATEASRTNLVDISDPRAPRLIPGGTFIINDGTRDRFGRPMQLAAYFGHVNGDRAYYARHVIGGGLLVFDISDETAPGFLGSWTGPFMSNGGYVFIHEDTAFLGLSAFAYTVDITDPANPVGLERFDMPGDLDTIVPIGNVAVLSVDDDAVVDQATAVMPHVEAPDVRAPRVNMVRPRDGESDVALSSRVGVTLDEFVELRTVHRGSFRVEVQGTGYPIEGTYSGQEGIVNFHPDNPLRPSTTYEVVFPVGGVADVSGNPIAVEHRSTFTTVDCE